MQEENRVFVQVAAVGGKNGVSDVSSRDREGWADPRDGDRPGVARQPAGRAVATSRGAVELSAMHWTRQLELEHGSSATAEIQGDLACIECGYNLRGAQTDGRCPECGRAVDDSIKPAANVEDVIGELNGLSWSYFGLVALVAVFAVPVGMSIGWIGATFIGGALAYRLVAMFLLRRSLRDRVPDRFSPLDLVWWNTWIEFGAIATVLVSLTFSHALTVGLTDALIIALTLVWAGSTISGLWLAGMMALHIQRTLGLRTSTPSIIASRWLLGVCTALAVLAGGMAMVGGPATLWITMIVAAAMCIVLAALFVFLAIQYIAQNMHEAEHAGIVELQPRSTSTPSDTAVAAVASSDAAGPGDTEAEPADDLPPIPLADDEMPGKNEVRDGGSEADDPFAAMDRGEPEHKPGRDR